MQASPGKKPKIYATAPEFRDIECGDNPPERGDMPCVGPNGGRAMPDYTRVIFVAPGWRRVLDETNATIRMEALPPGEVEACLTIAEPVSLSPAIEIQYTCEPIDCEEGCVPVTIDPPDGHIIMKCVCGGENLLKGVAAASAELQPGVEKKGARKRKKTV